jgi:GWxTD domain-containing protein
MHFSLNGIVRLALAGLLLAVPLVSLVARPLGTQTREDKEAAKYYEKWLDQDVLYIISDDERDVFKKLHTPEEKDAFIEQFWQRRSPNPSRSTNEFKEEHYRRIAHANAKFGSGIPGWKTDRGRIYIMYGEPVEIEDHAGGENYNRKPYEGGGKTNVFPFQIWRYRHLEGIGDDIEIEFVDQTWTGLYKIAQSPWEKDMLLNVSDQGLTTRERLGMANKATRPGIHPGNLNNTSVMSKQYGMRLEDAPFQRMLRYYDLQRPPIVKHKELRTIVETNITYSTLPFHYALNYVWVDGEKALVPITMEIDNSRLAFTETSGVYRARVGLYGAVTALNGRIVAEFEDSIALEYRPERFEASKTLKSMYQKPVLLPAGVYKLDLVVKDVNAGNVGTISTRVSVPRFVRDALAASPPLVAKFIQPMDTFPEAPTTFVIGDLKVVPNVSRTYRPADPLNVYFQVYNAAVDPASNKPKLALQYSILKNGRSVLQLTDSGAASVVYSTDQRVVAARRLSLAGLDAGDYTLKVDIKDSISGQTTSQESPFKIAAP